jgi:hypothetical protein
LIVVLLVIETTEQQMVFDKNGVNPAHFGVWPAQSLHNRALVVEGQYSNKFAFVKEQEITLRESDAGAVVKLAFELMRDKARRHRLPGRCLFLRS